MGLKTYHKILIILLALIAFGLVMVYSSSYLRAGSSGQIEDGYCRRRPALAENRAAGFPALGTGKNNPGNLYCRFHQPLPGTAQVI